MELTEVKVLDHLYIPDAWNVYQSCEVLKVDMTNGLITIERADGKLTKVNPSWLRVSDATFEACLR